MQILVASSYIITDVFVTPKQLPCVWLQGDMGDMQMQRSHEPLRMQGYCLHHWCSSISAMVQGSHVSVLLCIMGEILALFAETGFYGR